jgi:hypothetical protein
MWLGKFVMKEVLAALWLGEEMMNEDRKEGSSKVLMIKWIGKKKMRKCQ